MPQPVYVTSGTHKNLFFPTPTSTTTPDPGWAAAGAALEGSGGLVAGITGGTGIGLVIGLLLLLAGFLMQLFGTDSSTTELPDSSGDVASVNGPAAGAGSTSGGAFVPADLVVISTLPNNDQCQPPAWWSYPGRWGVAVNSGTQSWDSGGRRIDFKGRSRAYWNTVWLQRAKNL
jgi:hypothetical protein